VTFTISSSQLAELNNYRYLAAMNWLTKQEQLVLCAIIALLLTGLLVKFYRTAHTTTVASQSAKP
jgi:hypothetical protein